MRRVGIIGLATAAAALVVAGGAGLPAGAADFAAGGYGNGGFETPVIAAPYLTVDPGGTILDGTSGWTVGGAGVDIISAPSYPVHSGAQALDLNACDAGSITQTFPTVAGHTYDILYWVNSNGATNWNIDVHGGLSANGNGHYTGDAATSGAHQVVDGWEQWGPQNILANGTEAVLTFTSLDTSTCGGVILDDIAVTTHNTAPVVADQSRSVDEDFFTVPPITLGPLTDADTDAVTYTLASGPAHGTVLINGGNQAAYIPAPNYNGPDSFTVTGTDPFGESDNGTVTMTVNPVVDQTWVTNMPPSNGVFTNKKTTVVFHALVTSTDPACTVGRLVTFVPNQDGMPALEPKTVLTDSSGMASAKFALPTPLSAYEMRAWATATDACFAGKDMGDIYDFSAGK